MAVTDAGEVCRPSTLDQLSSCWTDGRLVGDLLTEAVGRSDSLIVAAGEC